MKKITLFVAAFLMSSVAFGQVNWGKFENSLGPSARLAVQSSFEQDRSSCSVDAMITDVYVTQVTLLDGTGGDQPVYRVDMEGAFVKASVEVTTDDLYHPPFDWEARVISCNHTDM